jgi:integrase
MASLHQSSTGVYRIRFRFGLPPDNGFQRSLDTTDNKTALAIKADVEEAIRLIEQGRLEVPTGVDVGEFILSGGRLKPSAPATEAPKPVTLSALFAANDAAMPEGAREASSASTEAIHRRHLIRLIGSDLDLRDGSLAERLQAYINARAKEKRAGKNIKPQTIKKELETLHASVNRSPLLQGVKFPSVKKLIFPKGTDKGRFVTIQEVKDAIATGRTIGEDLAALWECVFLTRADVDEFLAFAKTASTSPWFYPFLVFVADTGVRRSEVLRSRREDFDFAREEIKVRERKRDRSKKETYRYVPLTPRLAQVMRNWFANHPGGTFVIANGGDHQLSWQAATKAFRRLVDGTAWKGLRGFHVFRHSYASNLAVGGTSQTLIDEYMRHQTEAMRRRYRHLFPDERKRAMAVLCGKQ